MWKVMLRGLSAHKLRFALTALAIVLGVGFVSGTFVLTDTINRTFTDLFTQTTKGIDVAVRAKATFTGPNGAEQRVPMPSSLLPKIKAVPGVKVAEGGVSGYAQFVGKNGKPVATGGAPTLGVSLGDAAELQAGSTMRQGRRPVGPGEVVIDAHTATKQGFKVGDRVKILLAGPPQEFTITGIIGFGEADNLAGATLAGFDPPTAAVVLNRVNEYDEIDVVAEGGVSPDTLRDRIRAAIDPSYDAITGKQLADETAKAIGSFTKFINYALLAFAAVALFVGSFIIVNTFSIVLAQRTRELALLRCIGSSRRQVLGLVLGEASFIGVVASIVGVGLGLLIALALEGAFAAVGVDLPSTTLVVAPRTIIVGLLVGLVVTVAASLLPALKASRVPPVTALSQQAMYATPRSSWRRLVVGAVVTAGGVALLVTALVVGGDNRWYEMGGGALLVFLGIGLLSALVARPMARLLGAPFAHWAGQPGKLARDNSRRNPRRTASTASALMIGLALVSFAAIFATSLKASVTKVLDESVSADYILSGPANTNQGFSDEVVSRLAKQSEIASTAGVKVSTFKINGVTEPVFGVDPDAYGKTVRTETTSGSLTDLATGGIALREDVAKRHGWTVGYQIAIEFPVGGAGFEPVRAIYKDNKISGGYLLALSDYERHFPDNLDTVALVKVKPGVSASASRAAVDRVVADFPNVQVRDQAEYKQDQANQINQVLSLFYLLLALAVVVAFIGIVNTLALSVMERVRELGLLRALGMTKGQLRRMIRWEAVIISILGAVLGLVIGVFFGWTMVRALHNQGVTEFALPVGSLIMFLVAAALAGILAAVFPGRRAAKINMLEAITTE